MKISANWLNDYNQPSNLTNKHIAHVLKIHALMWKNTTDEAKKLKNTVIGKIISIKKHIKTQLDKHI